MLNGRKLFQWVPASMMLIFALFLSTSCSHQLKTGMGGFADISLNRNSSEYDIKRLPEISGTGNAIFGIPYTSSNAAKNKTGFVFRMNGVTIGRVPRFFPIFTLITSSLGAGYWLHANSQRSFAIDYLIMLPIAGMANNLAWNNVAQTNLMHELNYQLVDNNPDIDVFASPKYLVNSRLGVWTQNADAKVNVLGARIRTERVVVPKP